MGRSKRIYIEKENTVSGIIGDMYPPSSELITEQDYVLQQVLAGYENQHNIFNNAGMRPIELVGASSLDGCYCIIS